MSGFTFWIVVDWIMKHATKQHRDRVDFAGDITVVF